MAHFDETSAECLVLTYKEGLLSAVAHDLQIRVGRFSVDIDEARPAVEARFDAASLEVVSAMQNGVPREGALSEGDKRKIEQNIVDDVLHSKRFPEITFTSSSVVEADDEVRVEGALTLHGQRRTITVRARTEGDRRVAEGSLRQPDFGIKPYSAMLGTLKIKPEVTVRISLLLRQPPSA